MSIPDNNEVEISVFGRGSGEAIAVHVGNGKWILIDSLLSDAKTPVALDYLEDIGVDLDCVEAVLLTHWHDDHIAGAAQIVERCVNATVAIPQTLQNDEFLAFVDHVEGGSEEFGSGVEELRKILAMLDDRRKPPRWSIAQRRIAGGGGAPYEFEALAPSDADMTEFLGSIKRWIQIAAVGGRLPRPERNDASVASVIHTGNRILLFGADLEVRHDHTGWHAVHSDAWNDRGQADFVKIPHHGSKNAHFDPMWAHMCIQDVHAVLTPWNKNQGLPTDEDVKRIMGITPNGFAASRPISRKALKRMSTVDSILRSKNIVIFRDIADVGQVRLRGATDSDGDWAVACFGVGAAPLADLLAA
ncbi:MBL fold metallo-hydrolase [Novosphingobium sp. ST904]|uniref:MBL fold metallo-hydrolase n=1 Tax=Novosphingobium sp. ST904 TaxID=1684385 RepID=UPI000AF2D1FC|nr:MBL fold metallo-hydrolase [Novosphingobium sp. ST904]TCM27781.1 metallo-beta-lactamase superfamily protein [Novosphingobium sp. ST904]